jgi:hypothetical protein
MDSAEDSSDVDDLTAELEALRRVLGCDYRRVIAGGWT